LGKLPYFNFYPKDWRSDAIFTCSLAARGLWLEMMNMMHGSERYGYLSINGQPIPDEAIARYCGASLQEYLPLVTELERARILSRTSDGVIFSRRMVSDETQRAEWRKQKKGQRDVRLNVHPDVRKMSAPSASAFPSTKKEESKDVVRTGFDLFWESYPKERRIDKRDALKAWIRTKAEEHAGEVLASLADWKKHSQWQEARFIPHTTTFLNKERWKSPVPKESNGARQASREQQRVENSQQAIERALGSRSRLADALRGDVSGGDYRGNGAALPANVKRHSTGVAAQSVPVGSEEIEVSSDTSRSA
jgi:hypothetical protein